MDPECKKACDEFRAEFGWDLVEEMAKDGCEPAITELATEEYAFRSCFTSHFFTEIEFSVGTGSRPNDLWRLGHPPRRVGRV
jgi:hypothetical protein